MLLQCARDPKLLDLFAREAPDLGARLVTDDLAEVWASIDERCAGSDQVLHDLFCAALRIPQAWARVPEAPRHHTEKNLAELATDIESITNRIRNDPGAIKHAIGFAQFSLVEAALPTLVELAASIKQRIFFDEDSDALPRKRNAKNGERTFTVISLARSMHRMLGAAPPQIVADLCNALRSTPGELDGGEVAKLLRDHAAGMPEQDADYVQLIAEAQALRGD